MSAQRLADAAVEDLKNARGEAAPAETATNAARFDDALSALLKYIPTEATVIYLAISSAVPAIKASISLFNPSALYWAFVFPITPLLFLLLYFNQLALNAQSFPKVKELPWFRCVASMVAFAVWALCIPGNPFAPPEQPGYGVLFGIIAVVVAILLPIIETVYNWWRLRNTKVA